MSFIGRHPETPDFLDVYKEKAPLVLTGKLGLTGYNQAYFRNSIDSSEKMKNDAYIAENLSLRMDMAPGLALTDKTVVTEGLINEEKMLPIGQF